MTSATILLLCFTATQGFAVLPTTNLPAASTLNLFPADFASLPAMPSDVSIPTVPQELSSLTDAVETLPTQVDPLARLLNLVAGESQSDILEEEVTNGMTHALLDFGSFWSENAVMIKLLAVIGRIIVLVHSFAHGQEVLPDELAFQLGFLGLSCHSLYHAAVPKIEARKASVLLTSKDRLAFRSVFRSAGFSWEQFREISVQAMNWVTVEPGQVILDETKDDAVYWLYQGNVHLQSEDKVLHSISCKDKATGMGLLGEKRLASLLDDRKATVSEDPNTKTKTYVAGDSGATLLRMDVPKLGQFLRHNEDVTNNFGRLAFNAMQDKLNALGGVKVN